MKKTPSSYFESCQTEQLSFSQSITCKFLSLIIESDSNSPLTIQYCPVLKVSSGPGILSPAVVMTTARRRRCAYLVSAAKILFPKHALRMILRRQRNVRIICHSLLLTAPDSGHRQVLELAHAIPAATGQVTQPPSCQPTLAASTRSLGCAPHP